MSDANPFHNAVVAQDWIETVEGGKGRVREADIYPRLRDWVAKVNPRELLEIGAGQGVCSAQLDLRGRRYVGLEPSETLVERARNRHGGSERTFVVGSVYSLPFADSAFDAAYAVAVWHLLGDLPAAARELRRILRPGGAFLLITANPGGYSTWRSFYAEGREDGVRFEGLVRKPGGVEWREVFFLHPPEVLRGSLTDAGLELTESATFRHGPDERDVFLSLSGRRPV